MDTYKVLKDLLEIDSPSGYTNEASNFVTNQLNDLGYEVIKTNKGTVKCHLGPNPTLSIAAHLDTLGAIVSGIRPDGKLSFSIIGSPSLNSIEGEYVRIKLMSGKEMDGTILLDNPSKHSNINLNKIQRSLENMHIRLDEEVSSKEEVENLGLQIGDFVCFDVKFKHLPNGYIKSRFLDNKAGCLVLLEIAKQVKAIGKEFPVELVFTNYEEVGHGGTSGYDQNIKELLVIDMGVIGDQCEGNEISCSICAKDSSGPYDYEFRKNLVSLAKENNIPFQQDVYPYYVSDGTAALRAGQDFRVGLIGPGVAASHGNERTHEKGIQATIDLCMAYIKKYHS